MMNYTNLTQIEPRTGIIGAQVTHLVNETNRINRWLDKKCGSDADLVDKQQPNTKSVNG